MSGAESAVLRGAADEDMAHPRPPNADDAHDHDQVVPQPALPRTAAQAATPASLHSAATGEQLQQHPQHVSSPPTSPLLQRNNALCSGPGPGPEETTPAQTAAEERITGHAVPVTAAPQDERTKSDKVQVQNSGARDTVASSIIPPLPPPPPLAPLAPRRSNSPRRSLAARTASRSPIRSGSPSTSYIKPTPPPSPRVTQVSLAPPPAGVLSSLRKSIDGAVESLPDNMLFGQSAERRRRAMANTSALTDYEADLKGKDRTKQKVAIQKYLAERVKADWTWEWPRTPQSMDPSMDCNVAKSADAEEMWKERDDWTDDNPSENEPDSALSVSPMVSPISSDRRDSAISKAISRSSPFRFESPDGVGEMVTQKANDRKRRRQKRLAEEMAVNDGLKCFVQRRDAWTCARHVSIHPHPKQKRKNSALSVAENGSSTAVDSEDPDNENIESDWEYDTVIPIAPPILPKENAMRSSIGPAAYTTIYDKVILQSLSPSCPINLKDVIKSCIQGWQRDGEWYPPKQTVPETLSSPLGLLKKKRRKGSLAGILGFPDGDGKDVMNPKSPGFGGKLKRVLGLGKEKEKDEGQENHNANGNVNDNTVHA